MFQYLLILRYLKHKLLHIKKVSIIGFQWKLTFCGHWTDGYTLFVTHKAKVGEDNKPWEERGETVNNRCNDAITVNKKKCIVNVTGQLIEENINYNLCLTLMSYKTYFKRYSMIY